jgi:hypothetical protein
MIEKVVGLRSDRNVHFILANILVEIEGKLIKKLWRSLSLFLCFNRQFHIWWHWDHLKKSLLSLVQVKIIFQDLAMCVTQLLAGVLLAGLSWHFRNLRLRRMAIKMWNGWHLPTVSIVVDTINRLRTQTNWKFWALTFISPSLCQKWHKQMRWDQRMAQCRSPGLIPSMRVTFFSLCVERCGDLFWLHEIDTTSWCFGEIALNAGQEFCPDLHGWQDESFSPMRINFVDAKRFCPSNNRVISVLSPINRHNHELPTITAIVEEHFFDEITFSKQTKQTVLSILTNRETELSIWSLSMNVV